MSWVNEYKSKLCSADDAVRCINSGDGVYIHSNAAAPQHLIRSMTNRRKELQDVRIYKIITLGEAPYAEPECEGSFYVHAMFIGPNVRKAVNQGRADYTPVFFSDLSRLFAKAILKVDVCLLSVSEPDADGYVTLGVSLDFTRPAMKNARHIIAEVNKQMPRTNGNTRVHISEIERFVETDYPLPNLHIEETTDTARQIAKNVASLVEDGATLQMGIGAIPNAVLECLTDKKDLGVHTELFSDAVVNLVESGALTNARRSVSPGKITTSFVMGSEKLYRFVHENSNVEFRDSEWVNDPFVIAQNYRMTSINAALQVDLTGQVCADSLGTAMYSGCGGQVDFFRGSSHAPEGKAILALESTAAKGTVSRIVPMLSPGAGVVTSRADVYYVVTEYGIANLHGKNMKDRVKALIEIAHPDFRESLERGASEYKWYASRTGVSN